MNLETARAALALHDAGVEFAWVSIMETHGSSPRHSGAAMVVSSDGLAAGTVGGGPLEADCIRQAAEAIATQSHRLLRFDSGELGMACGGGGRLLIEYVDPTDAQARDLLSALVRLWEEGRRGWLVTWLPEEQDLGAPVRRCLVDSAGNVTGSPVGPLADLQALAGRGGTCDRLLAQDPAHTHVQVVGTDGRAYIFGAGHCGRSLAPVLAALGFFTTVIDDRPDFASRERFPTADRVQVAPSFDGVMETLDVDEDAYLIIVTRGHAHDRNVLVQALRTPAAYIGMIGSRKKVAETFSALGEQGFAETDLARVHAPIGISIGAETPEEIAISIAAELIQVRSAKAR